MSWTANNSTNIDWVNYEFDGFCPDCDFCRDCGCAHEIGTRHRHAAMPGLFDHYKDDIIRLIRGSCRSSKTQMIQDELNYLLEKAKL